MLSQMIRMYKFTSPSMFTTLFSTLNFYGKINIEVIYYMRYHFGESYNPIDYKTRNSINA